jgi:hypothetical protein
VYFIKTISKWSGKEANKGRGPENVKVINLKGPSGLIRSALNRLIRPGIVYYIFMFYV